MFPPRPRDDDSRRASGAAPGDGPATGPPRPRPLLDGAGDRPALGRLDAYLRRESGGSSGLLFASPRGIRAALS